MTANTLVTTDQVAPRERAPLWREWIWKHFDGLESDLYVDTVFDGHMTTSHAGKVILTKLEANRHRVVRSHDMVRTSETGYLKIVAPMQGRAGVEQLGRQAWVAPGTWTIYDTTNAYAIDNPERVEHRHDGLGAQRQAHREQQVHAVPGQVGRQARRAVLHDAARAKVERTTVDGDC